MGTLGDFLEMTIDANVCILIEAGIGFKTRFWFFSAFENTEVMDQETELPFVSFGRVVMFEGMRLTLGKFDEFTVRYAGSRPMRRKMIGVEFVQAYAKARGAYDDAFTALPAYFDGIHRAREGSNAGSETKIAHAFGVRRGIGRQGYKHGTFGLHSGNYDIFQMP